MVGLAFPSPIRLLGGVMPSVPPGQPEPAAAEAGSPAPAPAPASGLLTAMARQASSFFVKAQANQGVEQAAAARSELNIDAAGVARNARVLQVGPNGQPSISAAIERGPMPAVHGIVIHQTDSPSAAATLNGYQKKDANGAHFLIDKDGKIYQTASLQQQTWHVGKLRSRCMAEQRCSPQETRLNQRFNPTAEHTRENAKPAGDRYPSNRDAIGIELVGQAFPRGAANAVYEPVTPAQNASLKWLVGQLRAEYGISEPEVLRHPVVSRKNPTEASSAQW